MPGYYLFYYFNIGKWYFVTKIVLTYCEKKIVLVIKKKKLTLKTKKNVRPRFFLHTKLELRPSLFIPELSKAQLFK